MRLKLLINLLNYLGLTLSYTGPSYNWHPEEENVCLTDEVKTRFNRFNRPPDTDLTQAYRQLCDVRVCEICILIKIACSMILKLPTTVLFESQSMMI